MKKLLFSQLITILVFTGCTAIPINTPTPTSTYTPIPSNTPIPNTATPTPTSTPLPTLSPTPELVKGIGATRQDIQIIYEQLSLEFEPEIIEDGEHFVYGGIGLNNGSNVIIILIGSERNLKEASVTVLIPLLIIDDPEFGATQHGIILFIMQPLLDIVYPDWDESADWLDETLRSFDKMNDIYSSVETQQGINTVGMAVEIFLEGDLAGFMTVSLIINENN